MIEYKGKLLRRVVRDDFKEGATLFLFAVGNKVKHYSSCKVRGVSGNAESVYITWLEDTQLTNMNSREDYGKKFILHGDSGWVWYVEVKR